MSQAQAKPAIALVPNIEETVREYARLKNEAAELETHLKRLRNVIEVALSGEPEHKATIAGIHLSLVEVERDNFNLKKAMEKLDGRVLRPYITTSRYTMLKLVPAGE
jgi:hypothetical protein